MVKTKVFSYSKARAGVVPAKVKSYVRKAIRGDKELKSIVNSVTLTYTVGGAGAIVLLGPQVGQGDDVSIREGNHIQLQSMEVRNLINMAATTTGQGNLRLLIVYDRDCTGALPTVANVVSSTTADGGINPQMRSRFRVLYDSYRTLSPNKESTNYSIRKRVKLPIEYISSAATIAAFRRGAIYAITFASGSFAVADPTSAATVTFTWKE